jgi:2-methylcitrate dehydratase PrpD
MGAVGKQTTATLTEQFVEVVLALTTDETTIRRAAQRAEFDYLACLAAGRRVDPGLPDAAAAALLDRDDLHWPSLTHPGAVIWTVVRECHGDARSAAAGYEATARLALALGSEHRRYWHSTTTAGTVGAAIAAAVSCSLEHDQIVDAASHAISIVGGSILAIGERSGTRFFHRVHAAASGIEAARAAEARLAGTRRGLEADQGLFAAMGGSADLLLARRARTALEETTFRLYAATGFAQAAIEAARELAPVEDAVRVIVEVPPPAAALCDNNDPRSDEEAWWSVQYAVAVTLLGLDLEDRKLLRDNRVRALLRQIDLREGDRSRVEVDGYAASYSEAHVPSNEELIAKWRTLNPRLRPPLQLLGDLRSSTE